MSFYVHRESPHGTRHGWIGPIRSERQAGKEAAAWQSAGWTATVHPSSPEVKREVRDWQRQVRAARA